MWWLANRDDHVNTNIMAANHGKQIKNCIPKKPQKGFDNRSRLWEHGRRIHLDCLYEPRALRALANATIEAPSCFVD